MGIRNQWCWPRWLTPGRVEAGAGVVEEGQLVGAGAVTGPVVDAHGQARRQGAPRVWRNCSCGRPSRPPEVGGPALGPPCRWACPATARLHEDAGDPVPFEDQHDAPRQHDDRPRRRPDRGPGGEPFRNTCRSRGPSWRRHRGARLGHGRPPSPAVRGSEIGVAWLPPARRRVKAGRSAAATRGAKPKAMMPGRWPVTSTRPTKAAHLAEVIAE